MWSKFKLLSDFISNMGWRYVFFRIWHLVQIKTGIFKRKFPSDVSFKTFIDLEQWRKLDIPFFIDGKESIQLEKNLNDSLEFRFRESVKNNLTFFNNKQIQLDQVSQWTVNPVSGYQYDARQHWSEIADLSKEAGDIKYVWEKARFSYLYDVLRYDYHSGSDQSTYVFSEIEDFIDNNPINLGPQYKCSQEISLRILNWTYALHYYKYSNVLTDRLFKKIINAIYWQLCHVRDNIHFSRIAVRNNHAITETMMLQLSGLLFPFIPDTVQWSRDGRRWFEKEIDYQIYEDGTFLQFSMNYHRVVIQLLTWSIRLNKLNDSQLADVVYEKARKSLEFLDQCIDTVTGKLPNYGSNDGALFFRFTDDDYRVYNSQLDDLRMILNNEAVQPSESFAWYGLRTPQLISRTQRDTSSFPVGGFYIINEDNVKTFTRCGAYKDRPAQADNNHLDLWVDGTNYLWDNGSYKYNTTDDNLKHFMGTVGHNTVTVDGHNQMKKGGRFIWYYWIKKASGYIKTDPSEKSITINTNFEGYRHLDKVKHSRSVSKEKDVLKWEIRDELTARDQHEYTQHWHVNPEVEHKLVIRSFDHAGNELPLQITESKHSSYYGSYTTGLEYSFTSNTGIFTTIIEIND
jgi:hypothetical protein